jgi:DNA-binding FadR family transcriptional regulator
MMNERGTQVMSAEPQSEGRRVDPAHRTGVPPVVPRMADLVASQLRRRIIDRDLRDGDELPREADLLEEFSVSRPSLREAVRILETEGLLRIRRGKRGGAIVQSPTPESAAYHLSLTLQSRATTIADISAAREVLEPTCAGMLAERDTEARKAAVQRLSELVHANSLTIGTAEEFSEGAITFHETIVALCGNTSIATLTSALESIVRSQERRWAVRRSQVGIQPDLDFQREVLDDHQQLIELIAAGDAAAATATMHEHLRKSQRYIGDQSRPIDVL